MNASRPSINRAFPSQGGGGGGGMSKRLSGTIGCKDKTSYVVSHIQRIGCQPEITAVLETVANPARGLLNLDYFMVTQQLPHVNSQATHQSLIRMASTVPSPVKVSIQSVLVTEEGLTVVV